MTRRVPSLVAVLLGLMAVRLGLRIAGYQVTRVACDRFAALTARRSETTTPASDTFVVAVKERVVRAAVYFPGRAICLEQSLVLYTLLRRQGVPAQLRLGIQPYPFVAHAWVELNGSPVNDVDARIRYFHPLRAEA